MYNDSDSLEAIHNLRDLAAQYSLERLKSMENPTRELHKQMDFVEEYFKNWDLPKEKKMMVMMFLVVIGLEKFIETTVDALKNFPKINERRI